jgi:hypothetical protein
VPKRRKRRMAKTKTKNFCVPASLYNELKRAAKAKHQTLTEYMDSLFLALIFGEVVEHGN